MSERAELFAKGADSTLALLIYAAVAIALVVLDRRLNYLQESRSAVLAVAAPLRQVAEWPSAGISVARDYLAERSALRERQALMERTVVAQQQQIFALRNQLAERQHADVVLRSAQARGVKGQLARVLALDLDPFSSQIALDRGSDQGLVLGSILLDAFGVVGRVTEVSPNAAVALMLSDAKHRIPVQSARNGERFFLAGGAGAERLIIEQLQPTAELREGDLLETSGLGGGFPAGLPVGVVSQVRRDSPDSMVEAEVTLAARLAQLRYVIVIAPLPTVGPMP
jgi:rod shape-determining protein MreC